MGYFGQEHLELGPNAVSDIVEETKSTFPKCTLILPVEESVDVFHDRDNALLVEWLVDGGIFLELVGTVSADIVADPA